MENHAHRNHLSITTVKIYLERNSGLKQADNSCSYAKPADTSSISKIEFSNSDPVVSITIPLTYEDVEKSATLSRTGN